VSGYGVGGKQFLLPVRRLDADLFGVGCVGRVGGGKQYLLPVRRLPPPLTAFPRLARNDVETVVSTYVHVWNHLRQVPHDRVLVRPRKRHLLHNTLNPLRTSKGNSPLPRRQAHFPHPTTLSPPPKCPFPSSPPSPTAPDGPRGDVLCARARRARRGRARRRREHTPHPTATTHSPGPSRETTDSSTIVFSALVPRKLPHPSPLRSPPPPAQRTCSPWVPESFLMSNSSPTVFSSMAGTRGVWSAGAGGRWGGVAREGCLVGWGGRRGEDPRD
jgi:hypothetical protein